MKTIGIFSIECKLNKIIKNQLKTRSCKGLCLKFEIILRSRLTFGHFVFQNKIAIKLSQTQAVFCFMKIVNK